MFFKAKSGTSYLSSHFSRKLAPEASSLRYCISVKSTHGHPNKAVCVVGVQNQVRAEGRFLPVSLVPYKLLNDRTEHCKWNSVTETMLFPHPFSGQVVLPTPHTQSFLSNNTSHSLFPQLYVWVMSSCLISHLTLPVTCHVLGKGVSVLLSALKITYEFQSASLSVYSSGKKPVLDSYPSKGVKQAPSCTV